MPATAWVIVVSLLIGACTPFNEMYRAVFSKHTSASYDRSLVEQQGNTEAPHYVGILNRRDLEAVLRTPALVPNAEQRKNQSR